MREPGGIENQANDIVSILGQDEKYNQWSQPAPVFRLDSFHQMKQRELNKVDDRRKLSVPKAQKAVGKHEASCC